MLQGKSLVTSDGFNINYAVSGCHNEKKELWIIFILPFGFKLDSAQSFINFFSSKFNVIAWESRVILDDSLIDFSSEDLLLKRHCQDMKELCDNLAIIQAHIVGYCSGAGLALLAYKLYPNIFLTMSLVNGEYTLHDIDGCVTNFAQDVHNILSLSSANEKNAQKVIDKLDITDSGVECGLNCKISRPYGNNKYLHRYAVNYLNYKGNDFLELASNVRVPAIVLTGEKDLQCNTKSSKLIAEKIANSTLIVDEYADHYELLRQESDTTTQIWNFICSYYSSQGWKSEYDPGTVRANR